MTTMGSEFWPRTAEGRVLCVLLALEPFRCPPLLGEHADEILAELDYLPRQTAALREQGALTVKPGTKPT